jgi:hypothetical protein
VDPQSLRPRKISEDVVAVLQRDQSGQEG